VDPLHSEAETSHAVKVVDHDVQIRGRGTGVRDRVRCSAGVHHGEHCRQGEELQSLRQAEGQALGHQIVIWDHGERQRRCALDRGVGCRRSVRRRLSGR
jgi:hypothetical protein